MKKVILTIAVTVLLSVSVILMLYFTNRFSTGEYIQLLLVLLISVFGIFAALRRFNSLRQGEPQEDELSKQILQKSAALSFYISLYLWLVIMYITDKNKTDPELMFGWGIIGMAIIFGLSWIIFYFRGIKNE